MACIALLQLLKGVLLWLCTAEGCMRVHGMHSTSCFRDNSALQSSTTTALSSYLCPGRYSLTPLKALQQWPPLHTSVQEGRHSLILKHHKASQLRSSSYLCPGRQSLILKHHKALQLRSSSYPCPGRHSLILKHHKASQLLSSSYLCPGR
eukprot:1143260-Pelagomonas_calceolata.AAC.1